MQVHTNAIPYNYSKCEIILLKYSMYWAMFIQCFVKPFIFNVLSHVIILYHLSMHPNLDLLLFLLRCSLCSLQDP